MGSKKQLKQKGIWKAKGSTDDPDVKVADFSYQNVAIAGIITKAWLNQNNYKDKLLNRNTDFAKDELAAAGVKLNKPVVITEDEYEDGWQMEDDDDIVFVLPNRSRVKIVSTDDTTTLLETAKMLMASVPNGI
jgi:hypothetical protein